MKKFTAHITFATFILLILLLPFCSSDDDDDNDLPDDDFNDDDDNDSADDDNTDGNDDVIDDDDSSPADDDTPSECDPINYLYGGLFNQRFNLAISPDGTHWAVGVKARQLMIFRLSPERELSIETLAGMAASPEMALGPDGLPRIVYVDLAKQSLIFMEPTDDGWISSIVAEGITHDPPPHLAIDNNGIPHIVFHYSLTQLTAPICYAVRPEDTWIVSDTVFNEININLAVSNAGQPIIAALYNYELRLYKLVNDVWRTNTFILEDYSSYPPAVIVDNEDLIHVVYGFTGDGCRYLLFGEGVYVTEEIGGGWKYPSIALDAEGQPHVISSHFFGRLMYSRRHPTGGWQTEYFEEADDSYERASIAVAPDGAVDFLRSHPESTQFGYFEKNEKEWEYINLDTGAVVGKRPVLRLDSAGRVHIISVDTARHKVVYKRSDKKGVTWTTEELAGSYASYVGLDLDQNDRPHIAVYSYSDMALLHGWKEGGNWQFETVEENLTEIVSYLCLELDHLDQLHLAYFENDLGMLKYATRKVDGWHIKNIIPYFYWANGVSLAVDPDGHVHISAELWGDTLWFSFLYASNALGFWICYPFDAWASANGGDAIAIAPDAVHIIYTDIEYNKYLRHGWYTEHHWSFEQTDFGGTRPSLAIDQQGILHATTNYDGLHYSWRDEYGWQQKTIDNYSDNFPLNSSLALSDNGLGHVAYPLDNALWYARFTLESER